MVFERFLWISGMFLRIGNKFGAVNLDKIKVFGVFLRFESYFWGVTPLLRYD
jgi:hypothetical protein